MYTHTLSDTQSRSQSPQSRSQSQSPPIYAAMPPAVDGPSPPIPPRNRPAVVFSSLRERTVTISAAKQDFKIDVTSAMAEKIGDAFIGVVGNPSGLSPGEHCLVKTDGGYTWYTCVSERVPGWVVNGETKTIVEVGFYSSAIPPETTILERRCEFLELNVKLLKESAELESHERKREKIRREDAESKLRSCEHDLAQSARELASLRTEIVAANGRIANMISLLAETTSKNPSTETSGKPAETPKKTSTSPPPAPGPMPVMTPCALNQDNMIDELKKFDRSKLRKDRGDILDRFRGRLVPPGDL